MGMIEYAIIILIKIDPAALPLKEKQKMKKFTHIVFGDSAAGSLKYFFRINQNEYNGEVLSFREDYSVGPLHGIDTENGLGIRREWVKRVYQKINEEDLLMHFDKDLMKAYEAIKNIPEDSGIVIWHGENAIDQTGLRYLCDLLGNRGIREMDVSSCFKEERDGTRKFVRALGECTPEEIKDIIIDIKEMGEERCCLLADDWNNIMEATKNLRILIEGRIIRVEESYYDEEILSNCSTEFMKAARVIGATMGNSEQHVGDTYIDYRLRILVENGKVEHRGRLVSMRDFEVRVSGR
jgi:hypothetical protein